MKALGLFGATIGADYGGLGLSRRQAHRVMCSCGYLGTMRATEVARRIRKLAAPERRRGRLWPGNPLPAFARWWAALAGVGSAA